MFGSYGLCVSKNQSNRICHEIYFSISMFNVCTSLSDDIFYYLTKPMLPCVAQRTHMGRVSVPPKEHLSPKKCIKLNDHRQFNDLRPFRKMKRKFENGQHYFPFDSHVRNSFALSPNATCRHLHWAKVHSNNNNKPAISYFYIIRVNAIAKIGIFYYICRPSPNIMIFGYGFDKERQSLAKYIF